MKKNYHTFKARLGLSVSFMMLFTLSTKAQCPSISHATATPANVCSGGNSQLMANAYTTLEYAISNIPYAPIETPGSGVTTLCDAGSETTSLSGGSLDDGHWEDQTIPFNFNFFGTDYTAFAVSTNGFLTLGSGSPSTHSGYGNALPTTDAAYPAIGPLYADLDFRDGGTINYFTTGTAPNRVLVINYDGGHFYDYSSGFITTQVLLYETSNIIEVHTKNSTGDKEAVEGIQDATASTSYTVSDRNADYWSVTTPDAYRFAPSGVGAFTYVWSPATFLSSTTIDNPMANAITASTTYTVSITNGGCTVTESVTVNEGVPLENTGTASPSNSVCIGTNVTLNAIVTGGGEPYTYTWTGPDGFSSSSQNPMITNATPAASGTYTIDILDNCGNTSSSSVDLTVNPLPTIMVSPSVGSVCNGSDVAATLSATGATSYAWSPADGLDDATLSDVNALPRSTTVYTVIGTDDNGCSSSATAAVTVNEPPALTATATPNSVCFGETSQLLATASYPSSSYTVTNIPFSFISSGGSDSVLAAGGTEVTTMTNSSLDDGDWEDLTLPFTFNYFGADYNSFAISTNGVIVLGSGPIEYRGEFNTFPSVDAARPSIAAVYSDLDFSSSGYIGYFVSGVSPNRVLAVNFFGGQFYDGSGASLVAQVRLYETSNAIEIHIATSPADNDAVEGIQNPDGDIAYTVTGRNNVSWSVPMPDAYRFAPTTSDSYTYAWTPSTLVVDPAIENPMTNALTSPTTFSISATATNGCSTTVDVPVTVNPVIAFEAPTSPICLQAAPIALTATPAGGAFSGTGVDATASTFDPATAGVGSFSIMYTVTDAISSCTGSVSQNFDVQDCTGITENTFSQDVNMYPNPTSGMFTIEIPGANFSTLKISIVDPQGKEVYSFSDNNIRSEFKKQVNLDNLAKGIYFIKLSTDNGVKVKKLTLQ